MRRRSLPWIVMVLSLCVATVAAAKLPSWDVVKPAQARFKVLTAFGGEAVLDKETGLVWETTWNGSATYRNALRQCALSTVGGRAGWRLPAVEELTSLIDPAETTPALPAEHPFGGVSLGTTYWSTNEDEADESSIVTVNFDIFGLSTTSKTTSRPFVCVRGGRGSTTDNRGGL
ncbi:MAG TPA: DUF1566 domain-containing protein [Candidatus Binatia bacterium]|nr:DUF1566 domain-containing protein [Candidatus Binatia bacterium]